MSVDVWLARSRQLANNLPNGAAISMAWEVLLKFLWEMNRTGACHEASAVFYMLLSELGLSPTLKIGEVRSAAGIFDHSWVEIDGKVFDAAVSLPLDERCEISGPVFASIDLGTNLTSTLAYGAQSGEGLGPEADFAARTSFSEYGAAAPPPLTIWLIVVALGARMGKNDWTFKGM